MSNSDQDKYEDFCCPLCESKRYKRVRICNGILGPGGSVALSHCVCSGCGVIFEDAEKFCTAIRIKK